MMSLQNAGEDGTDALLILRAAKSRGRPSYYVG
jgi:hypothetical protein